MTLVRNAQGKILDVAERVGQRNIKRQQGTTRIIYDTQQVTATTENVKFFVGAQNRPFPLSNLTDGNKLQAGESLTLLFINLALIEKTSGDVTDVLPIYGTTGAEQILAGEMNFVIGNSQVLKPIPVAHFFPPWNKSSKSEINETFHFDTAIVIPPFLEFEANLRIPAGLTPGESVTWWLRMSIEGVGSIVNVKTTF